MNCYTGMESWKPAIACFDILNVGRKQNKLNLTENPNENGTINNGIFIT